MAIAQAIAGCTSTQDLAYGFVAQPTAGAIAVDVARGLRRGRAALTIGWEQSWPGW